MPNEGSFPKQLAWKKLMKLVDLGEPTSFFDHVFLRCTQPECKLNESFFDEYRKCSNHESQPEQLNSYLAGRNPTRTRSLGFTTWKDMQRNVLNGTANWQTTQSSNCVRSLHHVLTTISSKKEELETVGDVSKVCSQVVLKCLYLARIGRPDILWSANKLALAVTKWTRVCDRRFGSFDFVQSLYE